MSNKEIPYKIYLEENEMPDSWYNVRADMKKKPAPLLNPATLEPLKAEDPDPVSEQEQYFFRFIPDHRTENTIYFFHKFRSVLHIGKQKQFLISVCVGFQLPPKLFCIV